ncbi:hypothetical protein [Inquilinus sp. CAU 1745]|uniref:hypothetical protein n=1 Tax=Inquilinus sp. CAU 1745 TaxID=3140369 RepID=UPI00325B8D0B
MPIERHGLNLDTARESGRAWNRETSAQRQIAANREQRAAENEFGFWDLLDVINPLQHIPVVSTIYRHLTGDEIGPAARVAGATLYGGPVGLVASLANVVSEEVTGRDIGETTLAMLTGDDGRGGGPDAAPVVQPDAVLAMAPATTPEAVARPVPPVAPQASADPAARSAVTAPATAVPAEVQPAGPPPMQTAKLENGFALRPQDWQSSRFFQSMPTPPEVESPAPARTIAAAPGEAVPIDGGLDAALSALAGGSSPAEEPAPSAESPDNRVPDAQIPDAMMRALDLYQQSRPAAPPGGAPAGASPIVPGLDIAA